MGPVRWSHNKRKQRSTQDHIKHKYRKIAEEEVIKAKYKYDAATDHLKELLDKKKEIQTEELMDAVVKSKRSYEEILRYINSEDGAES